MFIGTRISIDMNLSVDILSFLTVSDGRVLASSSLHKLSVNRPLQINVDRSLQLLRKFIISVIVRWITYK